MNSPFRTGFLSIGIALAATLALLLPGIAQALPSDRAYEMVSPPDKNDGDVGSGGFVGAFYSSPDGDDFGYSAVGGFGDAGSNAVTGAYAAKRGAERWSSTSLLLNMPPASGLSSTGAPLISDDFSTALSSTGLNQDTGDIAAGFNSYTYLLDVDTRGYELFSVAPLAGTNPWAIDVDTMGGNADLSRIVFSAGADLLGDGLSANAHRVYLYEDGNYEQIGLLPSGSPVISELAPSYGRSVSDEAAVAYFVSTSAAPNQDWGLFRRDIDAGVTELVNADENSSADPAPERATFQGASSDGEIAFFIASQQLVDTDTDTQADLYRYDHSQPVGSRLTLISVDSEPGDTDTAVGGAFGISADGETAIFTSNSQLVPGEPTDPGLKLFAWRSGDLRYVAPASDMSGTSSLRSRAKLSEDGDTFTFVSAASGITPEDNGGLEQVYVYDVAADDPVVCVSCLPSDPSTEPGSLNRGLINTSNFVSNRVPRRNVSDEGHVFFQTAERLLPSDTNGKVDVYMWQDGNLDLISTGRDGDDSWFLDASVDGSSVFIGTREQLSSWDVDNRIDAYVARVAGGLPEPTLPPAPCTGDDCQPEAPPAPPALTPGSGEFSGPGNPEAKSDCSADQGKVKTTKRKAKDKKQKVKKLKKKARKASGKKAKRLKKKAKKATRQAKRTNEQAKRAQRQLRNCRSGR